MFWSTSIVIFVHGVAKKIKAIMKTRTNYPYRINLKNTKIFMIFFVFSFFRDFVIKNLLSILPVVCLLTLVSCGPETILLRPSLDTPFQHVDNGYKLMAYGKTDAAIREFKRSMELDAAYSPAYVGLGIVFGVKGDLDQGRALMEKARTLARSDEQKKEVEMGFERLDYIERGN
jgi:hypothetical protein